MREQIRLALASASPRAVPLAGRRSAAVMLLLHEQDGEDRVLFQLRTQQVRHHRGEISLPGGGRDPDDRSMLATALRETHEEMGIPPAAIEVYGQLDDQVTVGSNYHITPFVGAVVDPAVAPRARARREVRELLAVPLAHLCSESARTWKVVQRDGIPEATPAYHYGDHVIWGATARVLDSFLHVMNASPVQR